MGQNTQPQEVSAEQMVVLFDDMPNTGKQEATYTPDEKWVSVLHDGQEMNMRRENWDKLVALVATTLPPADEK